MIHKLTVVDYLQRVRAGVTRPEEADGRVEDVALRLPTPEEHRRLRGLLQTLLLPSHTGRAGLLEIYDISCVRQALARRSPDINNWHYDRTARALLINLRRGVHEGLSAALYRAYRPDVAQPLPTEIEAERFLEKGLGWFKSAASTGRALKGARVVLDAQERLAFVGVEFHAP